MELTELIPAFAAKLGIEGLAVKDGSCSLLIDGIAMELVETTDGKNLVVSAIVGTPPLEKTQAFLELLLEANLESLGLQAMAFGRLHETGEVVLQWRILTRDLELETFCTDLEDFINKVEQWRQAMENFHAAAEEAVVQEEEAPIVLGMPNSGFISV
jgi:hypothetical protein